MWGFPPPLNIRCPLALICCSGKAWAPPMLMAAWTQPWLAWRAGNPRKGKAWGWSRGSGPPPLCLLSKGYHQLNLAPGFCWKRGLVSGYAGPAKRLQIRPPHTCRWAMSILPHPLLNPPPSQVLRTSPPTSAQTWLSWATDPLGSLPLPIPSRCPGPLYLFPSSKLLALPPTSPGHSQ